MHDSRIVCLMDDSAHGVTAVYEEGGKTNEFKTFDDTLAKDDLVVVESGTRHGYTVVKIVATGVDLDFDSDDRLCWVVSRIETDIHEGIVEQEKTIVSRSRAAERRRRTVEEVLSEQLGYEVDPVKMAMERKRRGEGVPETRDPPMKPFPERNNRTGPND